MGMKPPDFYCRQASVPLLKFRLAGHYFRLTAF
jgi:hypothetical protein